MQGRAATFTRVNRTIMCFCKKNIYKIGLLLTQTLAHDQRCGLLIAFPNEKCPKADNFGTWYVALGM